MPGPFKLIAASQMTMTTKIYIAGSLKAKDHCRSFRDILVREGYEVTSRWLDAETGYGRSDDELVVAARMDWDDIVRSDVVIHYRTDIRSSGGGADTELGIALQRRIPVICFPKRTNIFHWLPGVTEAQSLVNILEELRT